MSPYLILTVLLCIVPATADLDGCSEAICGVRVSKCMLLGSCNCSISTNELKNNNCSCCKECITCLGNQYTDCCPCVGLCEHRTSLTMNSYVNEFEQNDAYLGVWDSFLTSGQGTVHSFHATDEIDGLKGVIKEVEEIEKKTDGSNCTVIYLHECISHKQCDRSCEAMGASMVRWFHSGCCECIGPTCLPYGSKSARCENCLEYGSSNSTSNAGPPPPTTSRSSNEL